MSVSIRVVIGLVIFATACGSPAAPPQAANSPSAPTTLASPTVVAPVAAPALPAAPAGAPSPAGPAPVGPEYKGIPTSRNADGFHVLGAPEAPVTITDYSDFL